MTLSSSPLCWMQKLDAVTPGGIRFERAASASERAAMRDAFKLLDVQELTVSFEIRPWRKHGYRVFGVIVAEVTQTCVVSLEAFNQTLREDIDMTFLPQAEVERLAQRREEEGEIVIDVESRDPPEGFSGTEFDIGALTAEQFALMLDDYPRKPGVAFESTSEGDQADGARPPEGAEELTRKPSPFAALAGHALAKKGGRKPS